MDNIGFLTKSIEISEIQSNGNILAKFCLCDFSVNGNGVRLNRDTVETWMSSLVNQPLVGRIGYAGDFTGHNMRTATITCADGEKRKTVVFDTEAIGTFTDVAIETVNDVDYIVGSAEIWSRYPMVCELIKKRAAEGTLHTSWEISVTESHRDGDVKVIDSGCFTALCVLGKNVRPAYESSRMMEVAESLEDTEFSEALAMDISNESNKEVTKMDENEKLASAVEPETQNAPVVSEAGNPEEDKKAKPTGDKNVDDPAPIDEQEDEKDDKTETSSLTVRDLRYKLECMYYTEKGPIIEELGNTYDAWLSIVGSGDYTTDTEKMAVSIKVNEDVYENVIPKYFSDPRVWAYRPTSEIQIVASPDNRFIESNLPSLDGISFVTISKEDRVHKIPEKYYNSNSLFVITPTYNSDTGTWSTDRTWNEVKAAVAKSENPSDYVIFLNRKIFSSTELHVSKNSSGEITNVNIYWVVTHPRISSLDTVSGVPREIISGSDYEIMVCDAGPSSIMFISKSAMSELPALNFVEVIKSDDGTLVCDPSNTVALYGNILNAENLKQKTSIICPLYYDGETYHYESAEKDSSSITSIYFSTVSNGIYKRLKITQGQDGAADTVVMDKEIELTYLDNNMSRQTFAYGTIEDGATQNIDHYSIRAFTCLCTGTRNVYLTLIGGGVESEYELEPGGFYNGLYDLKYNGKIALRYSARGTSTSINFLGDISDIIHNNSKITNYKLSADQFNDSVLPRNVIEVDGTTIKTNERGQLTLALGNASGVSF